MFGCVSECLAAMGTCCTAEGGREQEGKRKKNFYLQYLFCLYNQSLQGSRRQYLQPLSAQETTGATSHVLHLYPNLQINVSVAVTLWQEKLGVGMKSAEFSFPFLVAKELTDSSHEILSSPLMDLFILVLHHVDRGFTLQILGSRAYWV